MTNQPHPDPLVRSMLADRDVTIFHLRENAKEQAERIATLEAELADARETAKARRPGAIAELTQALKDSNARGLVDLEEQLALSVKRTVALELERAELLAALEWLIGGYTATQTDKAGSKKFSVYLQRAEAMIAMLEAETDSDRAAALIAAHKGAGK